MATAAGGAHHTGMHLCLVRFFTQNCMKMKEIRLKGDTMGCMELNEGDETAQRRTFKANSHWGLC